MEAKEIEAKQAEIKACYDALDDNAKAFVDYLSALEYIRLWALAHTIDETAEAAKSYFESVNKITDPSA